MLCLFCDRLSSLFCLFSAVFLLSVVSISAQSEIVLENDFEKGTQKWETRGDRVSVSNSKDQALSGMKSLKISGRSANWQGGQLNVTKTLSGGKVYKFTVSVKLAKGEVSDDIKMTMQRGDSQYDTIGVASANSTDWTTISAKFKCSGGDPYMLVYIEAIRANTAYFIDDFKIELAGDDTPKQLGILLQNDFEDKTAQNWIVRGDNVAMFSSNAFGGNSLKVSGRTAIWHGLGLDISPLLFKGRTYLVSVSVRLVKGQSPDSLKITMIQTPPKGEVTYTTISNFTPVTDSEWIKLSGEYKVTTTDNNLLIYVEAAAPTTSFHIDNFSIEIPATSAK
jgi:endo-1,4-beta-xylanase